jgi:hypothetical protein
MTREQEDTLTGLCIRFGCVYRREDYRRRPDGSVEGWCGGTPHSGIWLRVPPIDTEY